MPGTDLPAYLLIASEVTAGKIDTKRLPRLFLTSRGKELVSQERERLLGEDSQYDTLCLFDQVVQLDSRQQLERRTVFRRSVALYLSQRPALKGTACSAVDVSFDHLMNVFAVTLSAMAHS